MEFSLRPVINATGVILHTNLGRAPLAESAIKRIAEVVGGYSNLEFDIAAGERGKRDVHVERLFSRSAQSGWRQRHSDGRGQQLRGRCHAGLEYAG